MGLKVHRRVLPVTWERAAPALARGVDQVVPHLVLMLGVATQDMTGRLENRAFNRLDGRPDAEGALMLPGPIVPTRPMDHSRSCHWPIEQLVKSLHLRGHQLTESNNAGRYLCNHTYYNAFDCPAPAGVGFLHVAPGPLENRHDPRRRLILDLIRALDLWLRT
jgi:pyroglutamyl-peptidase